MSAVQSTVRVPEIQVVTVGERGQPGPPGAPGVGVAPKISAMNSDAVPLTLGQPVFMQIDGTVILADAVNAPRLVGLIADPVIPTMAFGQIQTDGSIDATTTEWDAITGGTGGLIAGARYFLSVVPGKLVNIPDLNNVVALAGRATSPTRFVIDIDPPIFP